MGSKQQEKRKEKIKLLMEHLTDMDLVTERIEALAKKARNLNDGEEKRKIESKIEILNEFKDFVTEKAGILENTPSSDGVKSFYKECMEEGAKIISKLENDRESIHAVMDTVKDIANFCIKLVTIGYVPQFFNTTTKPIEAIQRNVKEIKENLDEFLKHTDAEEHDRASTSRT